MSAQIKKREANTENGYRQNPTHTSTQSDIEQNKMKKKNNQDNNRIHFEMQAQTLGCGPVVQTGGSK